MKTHKTLRIEDEIIEKIAKLSKVENRSFGNMGEVLLSEALKARDKPKK